MEAKTFRIEQTHDNTKVLVCNGSFNSVVIKVALGLIDEIGGLKDAVAALKAMTPER